jgi:DNA-binding transcriptional MocR family regulator
MSWQSHLSEYAQRLVPSPIRRLATMPKAADTIAFGPGEPDPSLFPVTEVAQSLARILRDPALSRRALQYGPSEGEGRLRDLIAGYMATKGVKCGREHVLLTNGSQQALHLITALLVDGGDAVAVQAPTYPGALEIFVARGAEVRAIDALGDARPVLIYAMANFNNPSGVTLTKAERAALVGQARQLGSVLVEDDPYEVLRYDGEAPPPLLAIETATRPIDDANGFYLGTFSKSVAPGFRVGWVVGPQAAIAKLTMMKQTEDLQAGTLAQYCLAELFDPILGTHADTLRAAYRKRRDTMVEALSATAGNLATWSLPEGGFFLWLTLAQDADTTAMLVKAAMNGITYVPGSSFFHDGSGAHHLRLSYSAAPLERIPEGVARLVRTMRDFG